MELAMLGWTDFLWRYDEAEASAFCWAGHGRINNGWF